MSKLYLSSSLLQLECICDVILCTVVKMGTWVTTSRLRAVAGAVSAKKHLYTTQTLPHIPGSSLPQLECIWDVILCAVVKMGSWVNASRLRDRAGTFVYYSNFTSYSR